MPHKGFFASLFDLSFSSFVTPRVMRVVYVLALIVNVGLGLLSVVVAFRASTPLGLLTLAVIAPLVTLLYAIVTRVVLEGMVALVRVAETNAELVRLTSGRRA